MQYMQVACVLIELVPMDTLLPNPATASGDEEAHSSRKSGMPVHIPCMRMRVRVPMCRKGFEVCCRPRTCVLLGTCFSRAPSRFATDVLSAL